MLPTPRRTAAHTDLPAVRLAALAGAGIVALWFVLAAIAGLFGCATTRTPPTPAEKAAAAALGISRDLDRRLTMQADLPLSIRCQTLRDTIARCERAGLPSDCAWNGWDDADHDAWTIGACRERGWR